MSLVGFVVVMVMMDICFGECPFPPLVEIRENPEFHELMEMDKSFWPRCLLWHGWLPMLSGVNRGSPWAVDHVECARNLLENALGSYTSAFLLDWRLPGGFDAESAALHVAREPDVWTDGSMVEDKVSGSSSAGAGFSTGHSGRLWAERSWGHVASCRGYCSVPGPLQSVQRAELWGVILALQASGGVHLGVDNLNVVRHVGRVHDGCFGAQPFEVLEDGDLLFLFHRLLCLRGFDTVRISKGKGHASEDMVVDGRVRDLDLLGNKAADEAADFGRRRVPVHVIDARRNLVGVCNRWYPVVRHLHRFLIAIARVVVNLDDGRGTAPDPLVWSAGSLPKRARITHAVRDFAFLPGPVGIWDGDWVSFCVSVVTAEDVRVWPYSVSLLVKVLAFLGTLHWPAGAVEFGVGGVSLLSCSFCMSSGLVNDFVLKVLFLGIGGLDVQFQCRLFLLVKALIFGVPVGFCEPSFVHYVCCLVALVGFSLGILGLVMVVFGTLVGKSAVMVLRPGHVRLLLFGFWMNFSSSLVTVLPLVLTFLLGPFLLGISL